VRSAALVLSAVVGLAACATTPRAIAPPLSPYERARNDCIDGRLAEAWSGWVALATSSTPVAPAAARALLAEVDRAPLDRTTLAALAAVPTPLTAEVVEQVAMRLGDGDALARARAQLGAGYEARASGRLRAWPFRAAGMFERRLPDDAFGPAFTLRTGWLASPEEGPGLYAFRVTPPPERAGPITIEVRAEGAFELRAGGRVLHTHPRGTELLPEVARVHATVAPGEALELLVVERASRARARLLIRPGHEAPPRVDADRAALAALDLALADGDLAAASDALVGLERAAADDPTRGAIARDARHRLARVDTTRPPELRDGGDDAPAGAEPDADRAPPVTSCSARARLLDAEPERLRHRPDRLVALAQVTPALVGPCAEVALRIGALLVETHQRDALAALVERLDAGLDPGSELDRARALGRVPRTPAGVWPPLGPPLEDGRALAASAPDPLPSGRLIVHDDWHVHVDGAGRVTLRSHVVACAGDAAATEALGEVALPDDAELVLARTWIRSRRGTPKRPVALEPEDIVEKASVSLPALLPGDCAEWAWFRELAPDPRLPAGAFVSPRIELERADATVARARVTLEVEPGVSPIVVIQPSAEALTASRPSPRSWRWEARDLAPRVPEPLDPEPAARRLNVRIWGGMEREAWVDALGAEAERGLVGTPIVRDLARRAVGESPRARLEALHHAVLERVERLSEGPLGNASWALHRARGERAVVLTAACREAGLPCDLVVARPLSEGPEGDVPDPEGWAYPLVRARLGAEATWIDATNPHMPLGLVPPLVQGVPARVLVGGAPGDEAGQVTIPRLPSGERRVAITLRVATDGASAIATGSETLDGVYAATWRDALATMAPEARRRLFSAIVLQALPGATLIDLDPGELAPAPDAGATAPPLVWTWRAHVPIEPAGGVSRALRVALLPEALARGTVLLPERASPLFVNRASDLTLRVTIELSPQCTTGPRRAPCDWVYVTQPAPELRVAAPTLAHERRVATAARVMTIDKTLRLAPALIAPDAYDAWKEAALASDRADYLQIVFGPLPREVAPP